MAHELEGYALKELGDEAGSRASFERAFPVRAHIVEAMSPLGTGQAGALVNAKDEDTKPSIVSKTDPEYSEPARLAQVAGVAMLTVVVEPEGYTSNFTLVRSLGLGLDEQAVKAVKAWRFRPGTVGGKPVRTKVSIEVNFCLL